VEDEGESVSITAARVERLVSVIAMASTVSVEQALEMLEHPTDDLFGVVEEGFRMFLAELRDAKQAAAEALEQLTRSKQEVEQKLQTIERQRGEIEELSAPIIDLWDGVLALPLIGRVDTERAARISEALLQRVVTARARWVIIDLTGVSVVDESTADGLVRLTGGAELLGAECIVTGIGPGIAEALLAYGATTERLHPRRTLREGLQHCFARLQHDARRRR
jgi:rsbT co-antagonist protein RsbR